jgi:hypothetical protein
MILKYTATLNPEPTMSTVRRESNPLFFLALSWNAAFSAICGLIMVVAPTVVAGWLGWGSASVIIGIGVFLLLFAARLILAVRARELLRWEARAIVFGDIGWVVGSVLLVSLLHIRFSLTGLLLVLSTAFVVGAFAALQAEGLRRRASGT